ncbi:aldo/keto reductase [Mycolicibacterium fluoranthenivorans]|uniref:Aldo/keto reductase n=1 Tax=Mycolicibacterium fluoranthenivorans TaxID=258505 RepID=A0A7G8P8C7_9MYCO|nr:aldo/keto reductase [Mycolicibacterium fluoranthenivorans]QNJ90593.1 aldo/keto reductase [Mycolicibacterium fluoranthenivorans]
MDPSDFRARNPRFTGDASRQNQVIADTVRTVAGRLGVLPAQVALAWVYAQAPRLGVSVVPIPGTRHANRLDENAASLDVELDDDALAQLQPLSDMVKGGRYADHGVR